jgi:hypothetical protein
MQMYGKDNVLTNCTTVFHLLIFIQQRAGEKERRREGEKERIEDNIGISILLSNQGGKNPFPFDWPKEEDGKRKENDECESRDYGEIDRKRAKDNY